VLSHSHTKSDKHSDLDEMNALNLSIQAHLRGSKNKGGRGLNDRLKHTRNSMDYRGKNFKTIAAFMSPSRDHLFQRSLDRASNTGDCSVLGTGKNTMESQLSDSGVKN
jgi:hypothetical protein